VEDLVHSPLFGRNNPDNALIPLRISFRAAKAKGLWCLINSHTPLPPPITLVAVVTVAPAAVKRIVILAGLSSPWFYVTRNKLSSPAVLTVIVTDDFLQGADDSKFQRWILPIPNYTALAHTIRCYPSTLTNIIFYPHSIYPPECVQKLLSYYSLSKMLYFYIIIFFFWEGKVSFLYAIFCIWNHFKPELLCLRLVKT